MKNSIFARFARAVFIFGHLADVLVLSTTWNDLFCSWVDNVSIWWQMFNFVCLSLKRWFQFNSRNVRTNFASTMALNNWEIIAERRGYIFRWRSRCLRGLVCLSSLFPIAAMTALTVTGFSLSFGVDGLAVKVGSCRSPSLYFISQKRRRLNTQSQ